MAESQRNHPYKIMDEISVSIVEEDFKIDEISVSRSIQVTDLPPGTTPDELIINFQRTQNGGGDIKSITINHKKGAALITFDKEEVVHLVQRKEHKLRGVIISVKPYDVVRKKDQESGQVLPQSSDELILIGKEHQVHDHLMKERERNAKENEMTEPEMSLFRERGALSECRSKYDVELRRLRENIEIFKLKRNDKEEHFKSELEKARNAKEVSEQHAVDLRRMLTAKENHVKELETCLYAAQRGLGEGQSRDDVELRRLRKEIEGFKLEQKEREEHFKNELKKERNAKEVSEQLVAKLHKMLKAKKIEVQEELRRLKEETERLKLEQRDREQHFKSELEKEKHAQEVLEQSAARLQYTLTATQNEVKMELRRLKDEIDKVKLEQRNREEHFKSELEEEKNNHRDLEKRAVELQEMLSAKGSK